MTHQTQPGHRPGLSAVRVALLAAAVGASVWLTACVPMVVTGAAVGAMAAVDRRTLGAQTEDQTLELKGLTQIRDTIGNTGGVSMTSYNRKVLLTGQVPDQDTRAKVEKLVRGLPNVRDVVNELQLAPAGGLGMAAGDLALSTRVKAALIQAAGVESQTIKVVSESGVVYLMGLVTRAEGDRAAQAASRVSGVTRVVTAFEYTGS
jgi:osmotically-inducible protein OsmY